MLVRRAVMRDMGGYLYQMGRGVLRLVPGEVMQGVAGYVRQVGKGVLMLVRCAVMRDMGGYLYQMGRGVVRLVPGEVMQGMAGYVRQVGKGVLTLVRRAVMRDMGGYLYQMGRGVLGLVRRAVAFLQFEDGWDAAGYICLSFGLALMLLGTLAAPDIPGLYLLADYLTDVICDGPEVCDVWCLNASLFHCPEDGDCNRTPARCLECGCYFVRYFPKECTCSALPPPIPAGQ